MTSKYHHLDARNLLCPLPVIRTQDFVKSLQVDDIVVVTCSDPGAINDIPAWSRIYGHTVLGVEQDDDDIIITIQINNAADSSGEK